ncbi:uncharacterized protein LOC116339151 isoform X2 [Contarinia nasturtii]|uniref:uncharacterized protein LOC116339151 isoform X2 n=1 Tax=Contarinia nasturtii TaxID=265458 RepID=UPI0012D49717|nr:uncharacterized protein LOC116339151 isoform X2 [Contarinia nasturtii]
MFEMLNENRWLHHSTAKDPAFGTNDQQINTWIDSSNANFNLSKDDDYFADDNTAILLPSTLNSPPDSVKSVSSNDDADCSIEFFNNNNEKSFNFISEDALNQPLKNSQDFLYPGPMGFHQEIEMNLCSEDMFNCQDIIDEPIVIDVDETPSNKIIGNDMMLGRLNAMPMPMQQYSDVKIKSEPIEESEQIINGPDMNMNTINVPVQHVAPAKLLARRAIDRPQLKLKIKLDTKTKNVTIIEEETIPINNNGVISTPQLTEEILEMEGARNGGFNLIDYIVKDDVQTENMVEMKQNTIPKNEQILPTPVASPQSNAQSNSDYDESDDTNDTTWRNTQVKRKSRRCRTTSNSTDVSEYQPKRPRGRPPKTGPSTIPPAQLKRLNSTERMRLEQRIKNNEASRKSRLNRKGKENTLFLELDLLMTINEQLKKNDQRLDVEIGKWKNRLLKLAMH